MIIKGAITFAYAYVPWTEAPMPSEHFSVRPYILRSMMQMRDNDECGSINYYDAEFVVKKANDFFSFIKN